MWKNEFGMKIGELLTNERLKQSLEKRGREDAENGVFKFPHETVTGSYARQVILEAANQVYFEAYQKRKDRLDRVRRD